LTQLRSAAEQLVIKEIMIDWLGFTIKILTVDVSGLISKLLYQYLNMRRQSVEERY